MIVRLPMGGFILPQPALGLGGRAASLMASIALFASRPTEVSALASIGFELPPDPALPPPESPVPPPDPRAPLSTGAAARSTGGATRPAAARGLPRAARRGLPAGALSGVAAG